MRAAYEADQLAVTGRSGPPPLPILSDARQGLRIRWAVPRGEPIRMLQVDVYDPEHGMPSVWDRSLRESLDARLLLRTRAQSGLPAELPVVGSLLAGGGGALVFLANSIVGDPVSGLHALLGGAAAGAGGYPVLRLQSARRWRTIPLTSTPAGRLRSSTCS